MLLIILVGLILFMLKVSSETQKLEEKMLKNTMKSKKN